MSKEKTASGAHVPCIDLLACPFCGSKAEHESTVTQETIRCRLCPAAMHYDGSGAVVKAMWNARANATGESRAIARTSPRGCSQSEIKKEG